MAEPLLRAVLFDLDGTLVRTFIDFPTMRREVHALSERAGTVAATAGEEDILEVVAKMTAALPPVEGAAARREAYAVLEALEEAGCAHPEAIPGASAFLRELRTLGVGTAIITRNCRRVAERLLARMDLPHDVLIAREDTPEFKPHPAPVCAACARLDIPADRAAMVGDLWADIAAGRAARVAVTVGIRWPDHPADRFARCRPDVEVSSLMQAEAALRPHLPESAASP